MLNILPNTILTEDLLIIFQEKHFSLVQTFVKTADRNPNGTSNVKGKLGKVKKDKNG